MQGTLRGMERKILHLDLDAFFCAVEELHDPSLRGKPFAVGGRPDQRGVIAACSYAARRFGIHSAMPTATALRLCPGLILISHHRGNYSEMSRQVMARLHDLTPLVEQLSIDEAFADVSFLPDDPAAVARTLQASINEALKLPCSIGVATNKLVAKIANNIGKASARGDSPPNAITVVPPGEEAAFLAPLRINELWGVGPKTAEALARYGVQTIGDAAAWPPERLIHLFGKHGEAIAQHARGIDDRPVEPERETKSISKEITFARNVSDATMLERTLRQLSDGVGRQVRQSDLAGTTVKLKLRWADFTTLTRQVTLDQPIDEDDAIFEAALDLFQRVWPPGKPVRLIGVGLSGFAAPARQLGLWEDPSAAREKHRLQQTLDELRERYGDDAVRRVSDLSLDDL